MARGFSLHLGLNRIDPQQYGTAGVLSGCESDARAMRDIAQIQGFESRLLLNEEATADALIGWITSMGRELSSGDMLFITYAGHGAQVPDESSDEDDRFDETLCLFDRMVVDDELAACWAQVAEGARVVFVSDSCHSGTVAREVLFQIDAVKKRGLELPPPVPRALTRDQAQGAYLRQRERIRAAQPKSGKRDRVLTRCSGLLLAACQDNQTAGDGNGHGVFTERLLRVWDGGRFGHDYEWFFRSVVALMPPDQLPRLDSFGVPDPTLKAYRPFSLPSPVNPQPEKGAPMAATTLPYAPDFEFSWKKMSREIAPSEGSESRRCVFEIDLDRALLDGKSHDEVFHILSTRAVDAMMRCYVTASAVPTDTLAARSRGLEVSCSINDKGDKECKAVFKL